MKILLINSPVRLDAKPNCIPAGLAMVASTLLSAGYEVEIYDVNAFRQTEENIIKDLEWKTWDLAGVSGLITTYCFQKWLIPILKKIQPNAPVISGGGLATTNSQLLFDRTPLDIAVIGEGEITILEICSALLSGADLASVAGLRFRRNGRIVETAPREKIANLDSIPFPAWDLLPMEMYLRNPIWGDAAGNSSGFKRGIGVKRSMNLISSRGCPFSCNYCYHLFGRSSYRIRSVGNVIEEIEILIDRYGVDFIGFVDDNLMVSKKWLLEFCAELEKKKFPLTWGCHGRVTSAEPEILQRMAEAGCVWIGYGIESGSPKMLKAMNKKATVGEAGKAIRNTRRAGIYPNTTFIFGYPGETLETVLETVDFKRSLEIECGSFFATPYPGTPLYEQMKERIGDEEAFIARLGNATDYTVNLTGFDDVTLFELKKMMDANRTTV